VGRAPFGTITIANSAAGSGDSDADLIVHAWQKPNKDAFLVAIAA
jgi:2C-methyl-D-erythritol 2,4-cyclodiphosphate synthase